MISDVENNNMQNKCSEWIKNKNLLPNHKNAIIWSHAFEQWTEMHLRGVYMREIRIRN